MSSRRGRRRPLPIHQPVIPGDERRKISILAPCTPWARNPMTAPASVAPQVCQFQERILMSSGSRAIACSEVVRVFVVLLTAKRQERPNGVIVSPLH